MILVSLQLNIQLQGLKSFIIERTKNEKMITKYQGKKNYKKI